MASDTKSAEPVASDATDDEDLPIASAWTRHEWDCPACGHSHDEGDMNRQGEVDTCDSCGTRVRIGDAR